MKCSISKEKRYYVQNSIGIESVSCVYAKKFPNRLVDMSKEMRKKQQNAQKSKY